MELFIGGCSQNKLAYVKGLYSDEILHKKIDIIDNFHIIVKEKLAAGLTSAQIWDEIQKLIEETEKGGKKLIFISDEIGNGIVPVDQTEREWREVTGRILCNIAECAEKVTRIVMGLAQVIKG